MSKSHEPPLHLNPCHISSRQCVPSDFVLGSGLATSPLHGNRTQAPIRGLNLETVYTWEWELVEKSEESKGDGVVLGMQLCLIHLWLSRTCPCAFSTPVCFHQKCGVPTHTENFPIAHVNNKSHPQGVVTISLHETLCMMPSAYNVCFINDSCY